MPRISLLILFFLPGFFAQAHHSVSGSFDESKEIGFELIVEEFLFINPHPYINGRVINAAGESVNWEIELDNLWEMEAVGFDSSTLIAGDVVRVTGYPSWRRSETIFLRSLEHPRLGFLYRHNVRRLLELDSD